MSSGGCATGRILKKKTLVVNKDGRTEPIPVFSKKTCWVFAKETRAATERLEGTALGELSGGVDW